MRLSLIIYFLSALSLAGFPKSGASSSHVTANNSTADNSTNNSFSSQISVQAATSELTVTVKNINGNLRNSAQVKLYNSDSSLLINTLTTNTSGQATFSALADGIYNYEVSYQGANSSPLADNTEYWGSGRVTITGSAQSVIFTRTQPYISAEATFSPFTLTSGQSSPGSFSVKNTQANAVDAYVSVWVDQDKVSAWDYTQDLTAKTINSGSSAAFPFTVTPTNPGTYFCYAFVYTKVNGSYIITDQYTWYQVFTVNDLLATINVQLLDHNSTLVSSGNQVIRYDQNNNLLDTKLTDANGQVTWTAISGGTYRFEGYTTSLNSLWGSDLYWGSRQGTVTSGTTSSLNIIQSEPFIESIVANGTVFGPGSTVHVDVTVKNPDTLAKTCKATIRLDMDQQAAYDYESGFQGPVTISAGQTSVFGFDWTVPLNAPTGTLYMASCVQTQYANGPLNTDATNWDTSVKIENTTISQIQWSGYTWNVKSGTGLGPGPNDWLASSSSVWVDGEDNLHLKIRKIGSKWYCASINAKPSLGYGDYTFQVSSNVENMDKNIVLGLFTYETDTREIDIEFSRWGDPLSVAGWYNVQPSSLSSSHSFALNLPDQYSAHKFQWSPSKIYFQSYFGQSLYLSAKDHLINEWTYTGSQIPPAGNERVVLNLWLFKGVPPSDLKETEVVIHSFTFRKVGDLVVQVKNTDNTSNPFPGANGTVKLYNSANKLICTKQTDQNGSVTFGGVAVGSGYYYQVFHLPASPATIYGQEYWGSKTDIQVADAQTTTSIFKRDQPMNGIVKVYNGTTDVTGQLVEPGTTLRIEQQIINPSSISQNARGNLILDIDKMEAYDNQLTDTSFTSIPANSTITRSWTISPSPKGKYYSDGGVQTILGNDTLISAGEAWSALPLFTVSPSFNLDLISAITQKVTQHSTGSWKLYLKNTGSVNDDFSLTTDQGAFFYKGNQITKTPVLTSNEELNFELRFNSEMIEPGTTGKIKLTLQSNNDPKRVKAIEVIYTIIESAIVLTTNEITDITLTTATSGGVITTDGGTSIVAKGICWGASAYPTVFLDTIPSGESGNAPYTSKLRGLTSGTTYHVRAYAINSESVAYGNDVEFTTVVFNPPVASFTATPINGCSPLTVQFTDQSTAFPISWAWDINNDGIVDYTTQNPTHTYQEAGTYSVKLTVSNMSGSDSKTYAKLITVSPILSPGVSINVFPSTKVDAGQLVTFKAIPGNGGTTPTYEWMVDGAIAGDNRSTFATTELTHGQNVSCTMNSNASCIFPKVATSNVITMEVTPVVIPIAEELPKEGLKIYPNPTRGIFSIEGLKSGENTEIEVYTVDNRLIMRTVSHSETCEIDISKQVAGTYLVVVNKQRIRIMKE